MFKWIRHQSFALHWTGKGILNPRPKHSAVIPNNFEKYDDLRQLYNPQVPEYFNFAKDVLDKWTEKEKSGTKTPNPAFWWVNSRKDQVTWSFEELGYYSRKLANVLSGECDLQKGDRVMLILPRLPEWWLVNVACMRTGTVLIPGTNQLTVKDVIHRLQASNAKCIITDESLASQLHSTIPSSLLPKAKLVVADRNIEGWMNLRTLLRNASSDHICTETRSIDPMTIFFTSGTTGLPKMTLHSHSSYGIGLSVNGRYWLDLTERDVFWNTSDTGWAKSAWSSVFASWIQGACVFVHQMPRFETSTVLEDACARGPDQVQIPKAETLCMWWRAH